MGVLRSTWRELFPSRLLREFISVYVLCWEWHNSLLSQLILKEIRTFQRR